MTELSDKRTTNIHTR